MPLSGMFAPCLGSLIKINRDPNKGTGCLEEEEEEEECAEEFTQLF